MTTMQVPGVETDKWPSLGFQVCNFIEERLVFGPGDLRGQPAVLDNEKRSLIWRMYEIYPENHPKAGRRRFKRVAVSLRKGTAKTEFAAWIAACELHPEGPVRCDGYHVEKIIFESRPKHYVTAILFLPDAEKYKAPYPGVLVPCGHSNIAKAADSYQKMGALLALNGMAALVFDPIDQGERGQLIEDWPKLWGTKAHTMVAIGSILLGRNTATFEVWDGMRGIDYLQSRQEVDPKRIGCTGNSGGGTQTSYLMALDDRIIAASPSCYITNFDRLLNTLGGQDAEQNIYAQLAFGMDHADYLMMRAPTPILIESGFNVFRFPTRVSSSATRSEPMI